MEQYKQEFIEFMVDSEVLKFGEFTLKSGRKSPFFMNAGGYVTGSQLKKLGEYYAHAIHDKYGDDFDVLFGPAYKGIPLSVVTAIAFSELYGKEIRYCSDRKEEKDHGADKGNFLGSKLKDGDRVVMIEDVTTSGKSMEETVPKVKGAANVEIVGLMVSLDRMEVGKGGVKCALDEVHDLYGFETNAIVTMQEVIEHLYNKEYKGKVIGFSSRLNTLLVPQAFMDWSNQYYAPNEHSDPTRLILQIDNPANEKFSQYTEKKGIEIENDKLNSQKTTYFLRMMVSMVMVVGLVISILSFYILMLSIYLLVQKNSSKLENLLLIGYSPNNVARPYQLLTMFLNVGVLLLAWTILYFIRDYYMGFIETLFPDIDKGNVLPAVVLGVALFLLVSICNLLAIRHKITRIWKRKE